MKPLGVFILFLTLFVNQLFAQTQENLWVFGANTSFINLQGDNNDKGINFGLPAISLSRYLGGGISIGGQTSIADVDNLSKSYSYRSLDGFVKINFAQGKFIPSLIGGYGFSQFADGLEREGFFPSTETSRTIFGGLNFSIYLTNRLAINLQSSYRSMNENDGFDHLQHNLGISLGFGSNDSDKDGISDKKDKCPSVPGLKKYDGCPDTDGDGIIDKDDKCPEVKGLEKFDGCLDSDNDGIPDPEDQCPNKKGTNEMNGCPDTDGDNVPDNNDKCLDEVGPIENDGCPWTDSDGDGVIDKDDLCKDEKGTKENNGCPVLSNEIVKTLNEFGSRINFPANSFQIIGRKTIENLINIKNLLEENIDGNLLIEGYASSDGDEQYNTQLSINRAEAVRDYLIKLGVAPERLDIKGYGEENPLEDNESQEGRAINRRVQFKSN